MTTRSKPTRAERHATILALRELGLTRQQIANAMGVSPSTVHDIYWDPDRSKAKERRKRYAGTCVDCGNPTDGSDGPGRASRRCRHCHALSLHAKKHWTRERVIAAIQRWNREHGQPPKAYDWQTGERPDWAPSSGSVYGGPTTPFAAWADAIEAAGFPRPRPGKYPRRGGTFGIGPAQKRVLDLLADREPLTIRQIATSLNMPRVTANNCIVTLRRRELVRLVGHTAVRGQQTTIWTLA